MNRMNRTVLASKKQLTTLIPWGSLGALRFRVLTTLRSGDFGRKSRFVFFADVTRRYHFAENHDLLVLTMLRRGKML